MNRLRKTLANLGDRKLLVPFFTAGYPDLKSSTKFVETAADCGADIIEIGVPFSDPLADGPQIQHSSYTALKNGISLYRILESVNKLREHLSVPLVLMGYYNPILAYSPGKFLKNAHSAGVDGLIIPDLPIDEAADFSHEMERSGLSAIFLVAPTSSDERMRRIDEMSTDLVYAVTVTGVTGARKKFGADTDTYLRHLKSTLDKPFVAGFGVSSPETAKRMCRYADGVVIGSALVQEIRQARNRREAANRAGRFLKTIRKAI